MINIFIALLMLIMSYSFFSFSFMVHGLNRLIINVPRTIFEYSIVVGDNLRPYYDQATIKKKYLSYLEENIYHYVDSYEAKFRFYYPDTGGLCDEKCEGVEVTISSYIIFKYNYHRTMFYEITEVNNG